MCHGHNLSTSCGHDRFPVEGNARLFALRLRPTVDLLLPPVEHAHAVVTNRDSARASPPLGTAAG